MEVSSPYPAYGALGYGAAISPLSIPVIEAFTVYYTGYGAAPYGFAGYGSGNPLTLTEADSSGDSQRWRLLAMRRGRR